MLGLGLASSHAPAMFCPAEVWPTVYAGIPDYMKGSQPHTARLETPDVIAGYIERIDRHFETLRKLIEGFRPDAIVFVGDDEGDLFNLNHFPTFSVYCGDAVWGSTAPRYMNEPPEKSRITMPCHGELGRFIVKGLLARQFDPSFCQDMQPVGRPEQGISHMVAYPYPRLLPRGDVPIVPIFINEYFDPMPNGERCWAFGRALGEILNEWPGRVAVYASGGLSHDPGGPRAGWIDEPLDRWVLEQITANNDSLKNLFAFDSSSLRGGSGEIRAWISVAAACGRPGTVLDYIPCHHAKTGLSFAYWPDVSGDAPESS